MKTVASPPSFQVTFAWGTVGRQFELAAPTGGRFGCQYDATGRFNRLINLDGDRTTNTDGTNNSDYDNKYAPISNRCAVAEAEGSRATWLYDHLYQLRSENCTGTTLFLKTLTYDPICNRVTNTESSVQTTYTHDAANQPRNGNLSSAWSPEAMIVIEGVHQVYFVASKEITLHLSSGRP